MSSASSSTTSLISGSSSSSTSTSTKDYAAAFANLQSSFGYGGMAPRVVPKKPKFVQPLPYDAHVAPAAIGSGAHAQAPAAKNFQGPKVSRWVSKRNKQHLSLSGCAHVPPPPNGERVWPWRLLNRPCCSLTICNL
uniref:Uncharacterized protein n=1 Tax=Mycena chlorophos TaxID=658473 RepID=A0ABQ0LCR0_MYCCL|nr:predicted protein [Mycena chlorophos]